MSPRTLCRRLRDAGISYQLSVDGVRKELALECLERSELSVGEIAERLGYSDATNFRRAFRRWTSRRASDFRSS